MKRLIICGFIAIQCFGDGSNATNVFCVAKASYVITDAVTLNTSGEPHLLESKEMVSALCGEGVRVFIVTIPSESTGTVAVVGAPPFPRCAIKFNPALTLDRYIFSPENGITVKLRPISKSRYESVINGNYIWTKNGDILFELGVIADDSYLHKDHVAYYLLEDVYSFCTKRTDEMMMRRITGGWRYNTEKKIIFKSVDE